MKIEGVLYTTQDNLAGYSKTSAGEKSTSLAVPCSGHPV